MDQHTPGAHHGSHHDMGNLGTNAMAISATLHCLTGCAIGEILGLMIGTALGLANLAHHRRSRSAWRSSSATRCRRCRSSGPGSGVGAALTVVLAADTLSIATMEVVDNAGHGGHPGRDGRRAGQPGLLALDDARAHGGVLRRVAREPLPAGTRQGTRPHPRVPRRRPGGRPPVHPGPPPPRRSSPPSSPSCWAASSSRSPTSWKDAPESTGHAARAAR